MMFASFRFLLFAYKRVGGGLPTTPTTGTRLRRKSGEALLAACSGV